MSERRGLFGEISWLQVAGSVLAAVTSAWLASRLGVAGTMIGVALGSFIATVGSAFYARTLDKGKTLLAQTASGALVERTVQDGEIAEALDEIAEAEHSPVRSAEVVDNDGPVLRWKAVIITTVVVALLALAAITTYELVSDKTLGGSSGTTIGDTFGGSKSDKDAPGKDDDNNKDDEKDEDPDPAVTPDNRDPAPAPTATRPTPTRTATPEPTRPSPSVGETAPTQDAPEPTDPAPERVE
ncbi:hypothetical protein GEV29_11075 [Aeromicrobium sp. SMF47]|uniref:Uncharacterized protein n=1 Tax=Aeromicrobium yanjiei TaxID=2662028 RepID=A0A5Q2ML45_9ACTN|nr:MULTISPECIES: hypothetical protein [Aeromicrobium]MRJ77084.1 hypothetical protein [Aeromicrobium yanjiei]MRK01447.1 hypothetical protein [Aeromicrobium sp. S22]QGG41782.1 hypothetical protein GEV26_10635 [Aeromicrobium yanjiei]